MVVGIACNDKPIVYVSVGGSNSGLDFEIDVCDLPYQFISTAGLKFVGDNVTNEHYSAQTYILTLITLHKVHYE